MVLSPTSRPADASPSPAPRPCRRARASRGRALAALPLAALLACAAAEDEAPAGNAIPLVLAREPYLGHLAVVSHEYQLPAAIMTDVRPGLETELWARVHRPEPLGDAPHPTIFMMHGDWKTCGDDQFPRNDLSNEYALTGQCTGAYPNVVQSHAGYDYLGERLASYGFVVVSINTNRGINGLAAIPGDPFLIQTRGRLLLKHIEQWAEWAQVGGAPASLGVGAQGFVGKLDLTQVGLLGHSRGGEGIRAAIALYREPGSPWAATTPGIQFQAGFELAPTDHPLDFAFAHDGIAWHTLVGTCDGDAAETPAGVFHRSMGYDSEVPARAKGFTWVFGANHNFYNAEWQYSDMADSACDDRFTDRRPIFDDTAGGSIDQQKTAIATVIPFMQRYVGSEAGPHVHQAGFADPLQPVATYLSSITRVERQYVESPSSAVITMLEDFAGGDAIGLHGQPYQLSGVTFDEIVTASGVQEEPRGQVSWSVFYGSPPGARYLQMGFTATGQGLDLSDHVTLDFRVQRTTDPINWPATTDFTIHLVGADGALSPGVAASDHVLLDGPYLYGATMATVRVPLEDFAFPLDQVRGVRFAFDRTLLGELRFAHVLFAREQP